ncbi:MAG: TIGR00730 family Rossman fold protein [Chloroflexi bacterium]|nr:TIGR00730 family Rossman fold protein [Chloroflexota bacterium]
MLKSICIFCGSSPGVNGAYVQAAAELGRLLAENDIELIYGGGMTGLMGAAANAVLASGGRAIGIIPDSMNIPRVVHEHLSELVVVDNMHERKALMHQRSDAFIALPGGMGTWDELFETLTWSQLGYQTKPVGLLNVAGYYNPLLTLIDHAIAQGFIQKQHRHIFLVDQEVPALLKALTTFEHPDPSGAKWTQLEKEQ